MTTAVFPRPGPPGQTGQVKHVYIPFRALVPAKIEDLLVAGRSFSSEEKANNMANLIPHCIVMGQAAGTAAALVIEQRTSPRKVDCRTLQETLKNQVVPLPGVVF